MSNKKSKKSKIARKDAAQAASDAWRLLYEAEQLSHAAEHAGDGECIDALALTRIAAEKIEAASEAIAYVDSYFQGA